MTRLHASLGAIAVLALASSCSGSVSLGAPRDSADGGSTTSTVDASTSTTPACARALGTNGATIARALAVDKRGSFAVVGSMEGAVDFGSGPVSSAGDSDAFVAVYDAQCNLLWGRRFGDAGPQYGVDAAFDPTGALYVTVHGRGTVDFGLGPLVTTGDYHFFVAKLDFAGRPLWNVVSGNGGYHIANWLARDPRGGVVLTGWFADTLDLGQLVGPTGGLGASAFVIDLDDGGRVRWARALGEPRTQGPVYNAWSRSVSIAEGGDVAIVGSFTGPLDLGTGSFDGGVRSLFAARLDGDSGATRWATFFPLAAGNDVAFDHHGNVWLGGWLVGHTSAGTLSLDSVAESQDALLLKLDPSGAPLLGRVFGDEQAQSIISVAVDANDQVLVGGQFQGTIDMGGGSLRSRGKNDLFLGRFGANGAHVASLGLGDGEEQSMPFVQVSPDGAAMLAARFVGTLDVSGIRLENTSTDTRVVVARLASP